MVIKANKVDKVITLAISSLSILVKSIKKTLIVAVGIIDSKSTILIVKLSIGKIIFIKNIVKSPKTKPKINLNTDVNITILNLLSFILNLKFKPIVNKIIGIVNAANSKIKFHNTSGIFKFITFNIIPSIAAIKGGTALMIAVLIKLLSLFSLTLLFLKYNNTKPQNKKTTQKNIVKNTALVKPLSP